MLLIKNTHMTLFSFMAFFDVTFLHVFTYLHSKHIHVFNTRTINVVIFLGRIVLPLPTNLTFCFISCIMFSGVRPG